MSQHSNQRVGVFVDVQNLYYSAKHIYNAKVNYANILKAAVAGRKLVRAVAYVIKADVKDEDDFFDALEKIGYEVRAKDLQVFFGGAKKGDWDVGIAMDIMRMAGKLDVIVLVSGDGDFKDLLEHVKALGCRAEVMAFGKTASSRIRNETDMFTDFDSDKNKFLIPDKRGRRFEKDIPAETADAPIARIDPSEKDLAPIELLGEKPAEENGEKKIPEKPFERKRFERKEFRREEGNRPQFERPAGQEDRRNDRPRFEQRPAGQDDRQRNDRPRFERPAGQDDRQRNDRPRFERPAGQEDRRNDRPRFERPAGQDVRPRNDRPRFERPVGQDDRPRNDRPQFDRPRPAFERSERPGFERSGFDRRPRGDDISLIQRLNMDQPGDPKPVARTPEPRPVRAPQPAPVPQPETPKEQPIREQPAKQPEKKEQPKETKPRKTEKKSVAQKMPVIRGAPKDPPKIETQGPKLEEDQDEKPKKTTRAKKKAPAEKKGLLGKLMSGMKKKD